MTLLQCSYPISQIMSGPPSSSRLSSGYGSYPTQSPAFYTPRGSVSSQICTPRPNNRSPVPMGSSGLNEMILIENAALRERIAELEAKVANQDSELNLLRASTADIIRRISNLESQQTNEPIYTRISSPSTRTSTPLSRPKAVASRSSYSVSSSHVSPKHSLSQSLYVPSTSEEHHSSPKPLSRPPSIGFVNVSLGKSARGSPMRKWMSSYDMKEQNNNQQSDATSVHATPKKSRRRVSKIVQTPTLPTGGSRRSSNVSSINSPLSPSMLSIPRHSDTISRGSSRFGSMHSLASSVRSINHITTATRDPTFSASSHLMSIVVNGKSVQVPVPEKVENMDFHGEQSAPKGKSPEIDWVYGFRGRDTRNNIHCLPTGEIIYFAGPIVILYNQEDNTQRHYTQHTSDVRSISVHPNRIIVASGQSSRHTSGRAHTEHKLPISSSHQLEKVLENDQTQAHVRIWDSVSLSTLCVLGAVDNSFERAVSCLAFSLTDSGALLACVDESFQHTLSIWDWTKKKRLAVEKCASESSFAAQFHPSIKNMVVIHGKGHFNFWTVDTRNGKLEKIGAVFEGRDKPKCILSVCFTDCEIVVSGDSNGTIALWDPKTGKVTKQAHAIHQGGVFAVGTTSSGHIISAGKDKCLIEWDSKDLVRRFGPIQLPEDCGTVRTIRSATGSQLLIGTANNQLLLGDMKGGFRYIVESDKENITAVVRHPKASPLFLTTSQDGTTRLWDSEQRTLVWSKPGQEQIECASFSGCGNMLAVGCSSGRWSCIDTTTRNTVFEVRDNTSPITAIGFAPPGGILVVSFKDLTTIVYKMEANRKFHQTATLSGMTSFLTNIDWSKDGQTMRVNTQMGQLMFYSKAGDQLEQSSQVNTEWASGNCIISYETGLVAHSTTGVLCGSLNETRSLALIGRENGTARLYSAPVKSTQAGYHELRSHSGVVGHVAFVGEKMLTCGSGDCSVIQWKPRD